MKKTIFAAACLASFALCFSGCDIIGMLPDNYSVSRQSESRTEVSRVETDISRYTGYGFKALKTDAEREAYAQLDYYINKPLSEEFICESITDEKVLSGIFELYLDDHPEVFWIDYSSWYSYAETDNGGMSVELSYSFSTERLIEAKKLFNERISEIIANAPQTSNSYEKELYVHDFLIDNCVYEDKDTNNQQTAYGALIEGKAVCEGYTRAFQLLCGKLGVECYVIQGDTEEDNDSTHIWNSVCLDGEWYQTDVTWDDGDGDEYYEDRYIFFNITTQQMLEDHTISPMYGENVKENEYPNAFVPECTATKYNYFVQNSVTIDDLDSGEYSQHIAAAAAQEKTYCDFIISEELDFDEAYDKIVESYAYDWIVDANDQNGWYPEISTEDSTLSALEMHRLVTFILRYN